MAFSISDMWNTWNIRGVVVLSFLLQVFLVLFAPLRKKIANDHIIFLLWLAYLMADSIVVYGIGLISHNQGNSSTCGAEVNAAVQAFWASFLLLHLGGPDTITAFSLEDSSLWQRHLLNLIFQVGAAIYVFVQIFPNDKSLVIPTMLVFLVGIIKNAERTLSLQLSSFPRLRESMDPILSGETCYGLDEELGDGYSHEEEAKLAESIVVTHAYHFFQNFKVFLADLIFTRRQRIESLKYFHKVSPLDAFRVISVELQFIYEVLHTKALAVRCMWSYIFRLIALNVLVVALFLFNRLNKHQLHDIDLKITFFLLFGGIGLDVVALFMLVFSDWTVAEIIRNGTRSSKLNLFLDKLISATDYLRKAQFTTCKPEPNANDTYEILNTPLIFRKWSESIFACNLLSESREKFSRNTDKCDRGWIIIAFSRIRDFLLLSLSMVIKITPFSEPACERIVEGCCPRITSNVVHPKYVSKNPFIKKLWIFIFKEVRCKSNDQENPIEVRKIFEARGDLFLERILGGIDCGNLLKYVTQSSYDLSVLCWHIATEVWYNMEKPFTTRNDEREFSKILSDYMLYLFLNRPNVVFAVAGNAQFTSMETLWKLHTESQGIKDVKGRCMRLFEKLTCNDSQSMVDQGVLLAREMERLGEMKWTVMSGVWVEMLTYAATHISGEAHVQVLSKGGELLAFVWLLMAHFGCFYKAPWGLYYEYRWH